jgi:hypothetical protein
MTIAFHTYQHAIAIILPLIGPAIAVVVEASQLFDAVHPENDEQQHPAEDKEVPHGSHSVNIWSLANCLKWSEHGWLAGR